MRIAVFHNLRVGGAKKVFYEFVKHLSKNHELDLYELDCTNNNYFNLTPFVKKTHTYKFKWVHEKPGKLTHFTNYLNLEYLKNIYRKIAKDINSRDYDLVFATNCIYIQNPPIFSNLNHKLLIYEHEIFRRLYELPPKKTNRLVDIIWQIVDYPNYVFLKKIDKNAIKNADLVLVNSKTTKMNVRQKYKLNAKVLYPGININEFKPLKKKEKKFILVVNEIQPHKNISLIIDAASLLKSKIEIKIPYNYFDVEEFEKIKALIKKNNLNVKFMNNVNEKELIRLYNAAKFVVYTPINEPLGLVPLESMACATPVIGISEGGLKETIIDKKTGILIKKRDPKELAKAMEFLLKNKKIREQYGRNARKHVLKNWTWEKSFKEFDKIINKIATSK